MRKSEQQQMDMMDEISRYEQAEYERKDAMIQAKLEGSYVDTRERYGYLNSDMPDGLVVIVTQSARTQASDHYLLRRFRTVVGHHSTVGGPGVHLISCPNEEWPDEPVWQASHGCRWTWPSGTLWTRKEPEFEPEVKWRGICEFCYRNCDSCIEVTGPYPRMKQFPVGGEHTEPAE